MGCSKRRSRRVSHSNKAYLKKQEKTQATNLPSKEIRNTKTNKAQSQQKEGNNKDQRGNK